MENIVKHLSDIEETAVGIVENALEKKKELKENMKQKQKELDELTARETSAKLNALTLHLEESKTEALEELKKETYAVLSGLEQEFQEKHKLYAQEIFQTIVGE